MIEKLLSSYRSVLFLNGKKPSHQLLEKIQGTIPIIATDGAAEWCAADYVVGELDSLSKAYKGSAQMIHISDQYSTDFEKAMDFVKKRDLLPCLVVGISGGEIDHFLGNIQALVKHTENHSFFFLDEYEKGLKIGIPLSKGKYPIKMNIGATVSIFSFSICRLTTHGLFWELKDQFINPYGLLTIRNRSTREWVKFNVVEGKALIVIDIKPL